MTTLPPIQPRPIVCKNPSNNTQPSSMFFIHSSSAQPSTVISNNNFYSNNSDSMNNANNNTTTATNSTSIPLPSTPLSSYEEFLRRLREFHRCRQTTFRSLPTIAGQIVDLQSLYTTVVAHGGWDKVNDRQLWSTVALHFGIDSTCLNGTQALKNIYVRYLYAFEKISNGENIDSRDDDDEDSKRRNVSHLQRVPQTYNHAQHVVSDSLRAQYGLFRDFVRRHEYEKLELALLCGFPNELTFSLNTLLLLSSITNSSTAFHLYKCPRLLDILFCHIGLFTPGNDHYLKSLYDHIWSKHLNYHMEQFWMHFCPSDLVQRLLNLSPDPSNASLYENFNLDSHDQEQHQQELRLEQILMILRNLSFDRANAMYLLDVNRSSTLMTYKFLILISHCDRKVELQKYAFDIWTNLALYMHLRLISDDEGQLIRQLLHRMLNGDENNEEQEDRLKLIRALEMLSNLARAGNDNGIYLIEYLERIIQRLIHVSDILVLVHTLECLYQLSELGEYLCNAILKVQSSVSIITTLIDLLTIEARSFSSQTIKTIKIVEMSTGPVLLPSYHHPPLTQQPTNVSQSVVVIPANQQQQQTYATENSEMNKTYYNPTNNKLVLQQQTFSKPMTVANVISSGNLLAVGTPATTPIILANTNAQSNHLINKQTKHDCNRLSSLISSINRLRLCVCFSFFLAISETIAAVVNGTTLSPSSSSPPPAKRSRPSRPRPTPTKKSVVVAPTPLSRLLPSISLEDDTSSMESTSTSNSIHSTMADLLDRCSSPPFEHDIRTCVNDLCQRVVLMVDEPSISAMYNPIPSPVFKRKIGEKSSANKSTTNVNHQTEELTPLPPPSLTTPKKKRNRSSGKKSVIDSSTVPVIPPPKKEEPIEHEIADIKPPISAANVILSSNPSDYTCDWEHCRRYIHIELSMNECITSVFSSFRLDHFRQQEQFFIMPVQHM